MNIDAKSVLRAITDRPVIYRKDFRVIAGSTVAAVMLSQLVSWWLTEEGRICKSNDEIADATGMSIDEVKTAKRKLANLPFLTITLEGLPRRTYYQIDPQGIIEATGGKRF